MRREAREVGIRTCARQDLRVALGDRAASFALERTGDDRGAAAIGPRAHDLIEELPGREPPRSAYLALTGLTLASAFGPRRPPLRSPITVIVARSRLATPATVTRRVRALGVKNSLRPSPRSTNTR